MTIHREGRGGPITFECDDDTCHEVYRTDDPDFSSALADAKDSGWKVRKVSGEWMHFCVDHDA